MVRIGIMSFAHMHAYSYAKALSAMQEVHLTGVADGDAERGRKAAALYATNFYPSYDELLNSGVDGVVICAENVQHAQLTMAAATHKKHILCEKPVATVLDDALAMINACKRAGVHLEIAFPCRFHPTARRLKEVIATGQLGDILAVKATNHGQMPGGWFLDKKLAGGGAVMDHTVHVIDLLRWFTGEEVTKIYGEAGTLLHDVEIDDCGLLSLEMGGRIIATLDTSWSRPESFPTWGDVTMEIVGTKGNAYLDLFAQNITVYEQGTLTAHYESWGADADYYLVQDFVQSIEGKREPLITGRDGLKALEVALAAYHSVATQSPVTLENE